MKIAVYSGTFDPVHNGHIELAKKALDHVDEVAFVVEPSSWSKEGVASLEHREDMVELAIDNLDRILLVKNASQGRHTTESILRSIKEHYKDVPELYFLMGADTFATIGSWKDFSNIKDYSFIVAERGVDDSVMVRSLSTKLDIELYEIEALSGASSSQIRDGQSSDTPPSVQSYIKNKDLYA